MSTTGVGWERGDLLGHELPVHLEALRSGGADHLTSAFRAAGSLRADERVVAITQLEPVRGGSTGSKALLSVVYDRPRADLPERLFVKLSRDLDDPLRDRGRWQMEAEVRFGLLSRTTDLPVTVPRCLFGEYHLGSGSGILISERIAFGVDGVEPHHPKARDHEVDDLLGHYEALLSAMARLAGADRAGRLPEEAMASFAPRPTPERARRRPAATPDDIRALVARYADLVARAPHLLPATIRSAELLERLDREAPRSVVHAGAIRAAREEGSRGLVAFCHWNANIDNAWFWRDQDGRLACGLLDWGNVGRIDLVTAISSCLAFAEPDFLVEHLDHLLGHFAREVEAAGGGPVDPAVLRQQLALHVVAGGLQWPLGAVALLERHGGDLAALTDRFDPRIADDELLRTQLHLLTGYLVLWQHLDPGAVIDGALRRAERVGR